MQPCLFPKRSDDTSILRPPESSHTVQIRFRSIVARGGQYIRNEVESIEAGQSSVTLHLSEARQTADHCIVAAGAHSRKFIRQLGDRILLDTERGYHVLFPQAGGLLTRPVCYPEHGFYMTPTC
jgi:glycine/D-amino acid oxidase-like deaminating enzyme